MPKTTAELAARYLCSKWSPFEQWVMISVFLAGIIALCAGVTYGIYAALSDISDSWSTLVGALAGVFLPDLYLLYRVFRSKVRT